MALKEPNIRYLFDDNEELPTEVEYMWGRLAYIFLEIHNSIKKEQNNGTNFNTSGRLRQKKEFC